VANFVVDDSKLRSFNAQKNDLIEKATKSNSSTMVGGSKEKRDEIAHALAFTRESKFRRERIRD